MDARSDPRLDAAIRAVHAWADLDVGVTPVSVGRDERHVLIEAGDELFVLRLGAAETSHPGPDATTPELEVARAAASAGVGPEVIATIPGLDAVVTRFAPGRRLTTSDGDDDGVLDSLVGSLRALHACPPPTEERSMLDEVQDLRREVEAAGLDLPPTEADARRTIARIGAAVRSEVRTLVTVHGDLTLSSVLLDGDHAWIVDYRRAGAGDAYEDLGSLAVHLELDEGRCDALLRRYFGVVSEAHRSRLFLLRTVAEYAAAMRDLLLDVGAVGEATASAGRALAEERFARVGAGSLGARPG